MYLKIFLFVIKDKINKTQMEKYEKLIQLDKAHLSFEMFFFFFEFEFAEFTMPYGL